MDRVQIPGAKDRVKAYPHQFSGGMRQRIMIAMAIALDPAILIADEPTTALDVTVQAQIMALLQELREERGMGLMLITHDLGVVADVADRIAVMYAGQIVERAEVRDLYRAPAHPYTEGLLSSIPRVDQKGRSSTPSRACPRACCGCPPVARSIPGALGSRTSAGLSTPTFARSRRCGGAAATSPRRCSMTEVILQGQRAQEALPDPRRGHASDRGPRQGRRRCLLRAACRGDSRRRR